MKLRIFLSICILSISQWAFAEMPPKPEKCPDVAELQKVPFFMAQKPEGMPGYGAITMSKYKTNDAWVFIMGFIDAPNFFEAITIANGNLPNIAGEPEPVPFEDQEVWVCPYDVEGTDYQAFAITPLKAPELSSSVAMSAKKH